MGVQTQKPYIERVSTFFGATQWKIQVCCTHLDSGEDSVCIVLFFRQVFDGIVVIVSFSLDVAFRFVDLIHLFIVH